MSAYHLTPYFKLVHIAALTIWVACAIGMPLILSRHRRTREQEDFSRVRRFAHFSYIGVATPAAVIAVATGTALVFLRELFVPWMFAKLVLVAILVCLHGYLGHLNVRVGEETGEFKPPRGLPLSIAAMLVSTAILVVVLSKPDLAGLQFPSWLTAPLGRPLPVDEVPI